MTEKEKPKRGQRRFWRWEYGLMIILAVVYGVSARIIFGSPFAWEQGWTVVSLAFMVGVPMGIGAITAWFLAQRQGSPFIGFMISMGLMALVIGVSVFALLEVWICVLMAAVPMLAIAGVTYVFFWGINRIWRFATKRKRHYAFAILVVIAFPYLFAPIETRIDEPTMTRIVEDSIIINSTPELVWQNIIRMNTISTAEQGLTFFQLIGIPRPIRATLDREGLGGVRRGEFEFGLAFYERITTWEPNQAIDFSIRVDQNRLESQALRQIGGQYLDITSAGYRIEPLADGQIRLVLHSEYQVTTTFNAYAAWWADWVMHDFQNYVLRTVKNRLEGSDY